MAVENLQCAKISYQQANNGSIFQFGFKEQFPVPILTIDQQYRRINDGVIENYQITFNLEGKIFDYLTANSLEPQNNRFDKMLEWAEELRTAFAQDGFLKILGADNQPVILNNFAAVPQIQEEFPCKLQSISFNPTPDNWTQTIDYTISLLADVQGSCGGGGVIDSMNNSWSLVPYTEYPYLKPVIGGAEDTANTLAVPGFKVTHNISAVGRYVPVKDLDPCDGDKIAKIRLNNAVNWLLDHFNDGTPTFLSGSHIQNFVRQIDFNVADGNYGFTDTFEWLSGLSGGGSGFLDSYSLETSFDAESDTRSVTVQGIVIGLESYDFKFDDIGPMYPYGWGGVNINDGTLDIEFKDIGSNYVASGKLNNALGGWKTIEPKMFIRAQYATGIFPDTSLLSRCEISSFGSKEQRLGYINPIPRSTSVGINVKEGSISYSYTFNNEAQPITPCALSETLTVDDSLPTRQTAEVFVIGRKLGPVIQDLGTYNSPTRTVNYSAVLPKASAISGVMFPSNIYTTITGILNQFNPEYLLPGQGRLPGKVKSFLTTNTDNWDPIEGRFTKNMTWKYTICDGTLDNLENPNITS